MVVGAEVDVGIGPEVIEGDVLLPAATGGTVLPASVVATGALAGVESPMVVTWPHPATRADISASTANLRIEPRPSKPFRKGFAKHKSRPARWKR